MMNALRTLFWWHVRKTLLAFGVELVIEGEQKNG